VTLQQTNTSTNLSTMTFAAAKHMPSVKLEQGNPHSLLDVLSMTCEIAAGLLFSTHTAMPWGHYFYTFPKRDGVM
jgi:hypothetical protein